MTNRFDAKDSLAKEMPSAEAEGKRDLLNYLARLIEALESIGDHVMDITDALTPNDGHNLTQALGRIAYAIEEMTDRQIWIGESIVGAIREMAATIREMGAE